MSCALGADTHRCHGSPAILKQVARTTESSLRTPFQSQVAYPSLLQRPVPIVCPAKRATKRKNPKWTASSIDTESTPTQIRKLNLSLELIS